MLFSHGWLCLLFAGLFAGLSGWFLRQMTGGVDARSDELRRLKSELDERGSALTRASEQLRDLEADLAVQTRHARDLTIDLAERDRYVRELEAREHTAERGGEDAETTALRESLRRVGAARGSAERAHELVSQLLAESQQKMAACTTELAALRAQAPVLAERAAEARGLELRMEMITRDHATETAAVRARVTALEALVSDSRELESRLRVALLDRDATIACLQQRVGELAAGSSSRTSDPGKTRS